MAAPSRLDPKNDVVFKLLFGRNEVLLIALLTAVLEPPRAIQKAFVRNPELPKDYFDEKGSYLDILVTLDDGTVVDVEMQCTRRPAFRARALYYWASVFAGQLVSGDGYDQLPRVTSVLFLDYRDLPGDGFHEVFRLRGAATDEIFSPLLEVHTVELPKAPASAAPLPTWCRFLSSDDPLELATLGEQDPSIAMAERRLEEISADPAAREVAMERQRREMSAKLITNHARIEGREEGQRAMLLQLAEMKFGPLSDSARERIAAVGAEHLVILATRLLSATTLDECLT
ncbi:MAG TPA: Rpn family recombination-promoting nuclease/putative transposase [Polyangiaceae bacterium]|nr:Rpn family recombination-promoting nuclease/putative transposase [Polyangiaceae bacterium]